MITIQNKGITRKEDYRLMSPKIQMRKSLTNTSKLNPEAHRKDYT